MSDPAPPQPRFDVLIISSRAGFRPSPQGVRALMKQLALRQYAVFDEEVTGDGWVEIYLAPDHFAHHCFVEGPRPDVAPMFYEAVLRFADRPFPVPYGDHVGDRVSLFLEFCGAPFDTVSQDLLDMLQQVLYMRPQCSSRPHAAAPPRSTGIAADPLRPREARRPLSRRAAVMTEEIEIDV